MVTMGRPTLMNPQRRERYPPSFMVRFTLCITFTSK